MGLALTVAALLLAVAGVVILLSGNLITGLVLIGLACIVGPGGYSISRR
jgi:hypothetical protein